MSMTPMRFDTANVSNFDYVMVSRLDPNTLFMDGRRAAVWSSEGDARRAIKDSPEVYSAYTIVRVSNVPAELRDRFSLFNGSRGPRQAAPL